MTHQPLGVIMLAAGGTGGHVFPAQALAAELDRRGQVVDIVTDRRGDDYADRFPGQTIHRIHAATPSGRGLAGKIVAAVRIVQGTIQAHRLIRRIEPAAVVGFGGYPALPTMLAAIASSVPRMVHEQNAILGRVNRMVSSQVDAIATSFPVTKEMPQNDKLPKLVTGNPVRDEIQALAAAPYVAPQPGARFQLLVFGGSQGSGSFSQVIPQALLALPEHQRNCLRVAQQCRAEDLDAVRETYAQAGIKAQTATFFDDMPARLKAAHLVIARSGAGTVSELAVVGRPSILVPYPHATDDHQTCNAEVLSSVGGAWVLPEAEMTVEILTEHLGKLMADPALLEDAAQAAHGRGQPNAAQLLADVVEALVANELVGGTAS
jgi:UDP-N-acetylglucosamine--N-acetylmuramyl-(pentapeptide) pyrophosphoryl-undecaprenol N-acetylglucosamine transferase